MASMTPRLSPDELPEALEPILRQRLPDAHNATIANWKVAEQGYSTETYLFDVVGVETQHASGGALGLVLRRPPDFAILPDYDLSRQYLVMQHLSDSPIPVPTVRWIDAGGDDLGTPYFVMDRIDNIVTVSDVPPYHQEGVYTDADETGRQRLWNGCVDLIAAVHQLDVTEKRWGFLDLHEFGSSPPERLVNYLRYSLTWASEGRPLHPGLGRALDWAQDHLYEPDRVTLCWGDSRMSNVLYAESDHRPVAALDWEVAYLGDPGADLAWMFLTDWVSSPLADHAPLPGTPTRAETLDRHARLTGAPATNMLFNDVTAALMLAVPMIRLNTKLALDGIDLADICAQRLELILGGG